MVEADGRCSAEAYKLALSAYKPIFADLEALSAHGFCPVSWTLAFETVPAGSYSLENVRRRGIGKASPGTNFKTTCGRRCTDRTQ
ncbi:hypothetical protein [Rhizobium sp. F40D2]|uniref:hypothetical protein n=1 Tax=Rhizobium sp. F40D2 TaxID=3453141 RepID=UPI003F25C2C2